MPVASSFVPLAEAVHPPPCRPGDKVAVVSPSSALAGVYPHVHERGIGRLRDVFGLEPVEYPTTRRAGSPAERARDLMDAFGDDSIAAVMATIGGDDQITVLPHLDLPRMAQSPKRFFGYSDNTNLLGALVHSGCVAYHGGSTMVHLGRAGEMHPITEVSLGAALEGGRYRLEEADRFTNHPEGWNDPDPPEGEPPSRPASAWSWHGREAAVTGRLWGGCLEILDWTLAVGRWVAPAPYYRGSILFVETSEEMPSATWVFRTLRNLGERGILRELAALLVARPMSEPFGKAASDAEVLAIETEQREAVQMALAAYHPDLPLVYGVDAGHTDPQQILPLGAEATVDPGERSITVEY